MDKYTESIGKRKSARARVRLFPAAKTTIEVNGKTLDQYFKTAELRMVARAALELMADDAPKYKITALVSGGGISGQAQALRHGIARALLATDASIKPLLRKDKLLTRDSRIKERRKFGLKKARKSPQWSKR